MKSHRLIAFVIFALLLSGCTTSDYKVVDAIKPEMTALEAKAVINSYGFEIGKSEIRPTKGWPSEREDFTALGWRAGQAEQKLSKRIALAEYYPVGHGMFGAGQLFLFYSEDGRLLDYYRYQIN
jgi:hypothetical protein